MNTDYTFDDIKELMLFYVIMALCLDYFKSVLIFCDRDRHIYRWNV